MDWHLIVGIIAALIQIGSAIPYVWDMLHGTTRPNIISFGLWGIIQLIAVFAQISAGASWSVLVLMAIVFNMGLIVFLGLRGYGYKKYGSLDWTCLALAIAALVLWQITDEPLVALVFAVVADILASVPTIIKTFREPLSENVFSWFVSTIGPIVSIISLTKFDTANLIYPIYLIAMNGSITAIAFFGQRTKPKME